MRSTKERWLVVAPALHNLSGIVRRIFFMFEGEHCGGSTFETAMLIGTLVAQASACGVWAASDENPQAEARATGIPHPFVLP
jgi:hypothetical protein